MGFLAAIFGITSSQDSTTVGVPNVPVDMKTENTDAKPDEKKLSPCCVCKETKRERDTCIIENGEENCTSLIEAHKECMRKMGFNI